MKTLFPQYYDKAPLEPEWNSAIFAFDANVLLNLYSFSKPTTVGWIDGLKTIQNRIFLPYQAAAEYHKNLEKKREQVLGETGKPFRTAFEQVKQAFANDLPKMNPLRNLEEYLDCQKFFAEAANKKQEAVNAKIEEWSKEYVSHFEDVKEALSTIFTQSQVGTPASQETMKSWCIDGKVRYDQKIPPGYKDADKTEGNPYGDLFIWFELISLSKTSGKDVVFVTFEQKSDWFQKDSQPMKARKELKNEFLSQTGHSFDVVTADRFFDWLDKLSDKPREESKVEVSNAVLQADIEKSTMELIREDLVEMLAQLLPRERDVLRLRYGFDDGRQRSQAEVASLFGLSRTRIAQIEQKALRKLRRPGRFYSFNEESFEDIEK